MNRERVPSMTSAALSKTAVFVGVIREPVDILVDAIRKNHSRETSRIPIAVACREYLKGGILESALADWRWTRKLVEAGLRKKGLKTEIATAEAGEILDLVIAHFIEQNRKSAAASPQSSGSIENIHSETRKGARKTSSSS